MTTGAIANVDRGANNVLWGDYDNDGFIDLFVAISFNAPRNVMYHNNGNGTFTKITNSPPVNTPGNSQGAAWGDYDNDGRLDLIVNHTGTRSQLYHNIGGDFIEITNSAVSAVGSEIYAGASWGDYDNDGFLDLFVTSHGYHNALYHNNGDGTFARVTNGPIYQSVGKSSGGAWADYDNDGFLDLFVANDSSTTSFLFHNNGDGTFNQITSGSLVTDIGTGQGACWGDYDNNGFPDLFVPNIFTFNNFLYRNNGNSNAWLTLKLEGRLSNRAAIGAKVRVRAAIQGRETWQLREISGGGSLGSQDDLRAAFGLGDATRADLIRIEWPSGIVQELRDVAARQFLTVVEPDARIMPTLLEVQAGESAEFTVISTLTPPIELQWKLDGVVLPGETNATLSIAHVQSHDAGIYSVAVHQPATGLSFDTRPARLSGPVVITQQPTNTYVRPTSNALFRVVATGVNPVTCQWRFNGEDIIGATNGLLAITNCQMSDAGVYDAVLANSFGSVTSAPAALEILVNPAITLQPLSQSVAVGGSVTFSIAATGSPSPFTFEWRRGSLGLWTNVTSEPMSFLTLTNVQTNQAGNYRVVVKNAANSPPGLISSNAALTVLNDTDGDGLPDEWEIAYGLSATNSADAALDNDGDGMTNAQEYAAGTDPNDASSVLRIDRVSCDGTNLWRITFFARSNCTYTVQAREYCGESSVTRNVADVPAAPTNRVVEVTRSAGAVTRQQFFRLVTPRQP